MAWLSLIRSLVGLALALLGSAARRGSIDPEPAEAMRRRMEDAIHAIDEANAARRALDRDLARDPARLRADDGHRRD